MPDIADDKGIILFDGVCNLCNSSINFVIRHDKKNHFLFAPLQSETAKRLLEKYAIDPLKTDSFILIENENAFIKSSAALRVTKHLNKLYPLLYSLLIIPPFIRNGVYDYIAKNRYKWFGKKDSCMIPTKELKEKFIS
ncbi:MAG: thiol-disulfide oxidoreductase DCC family protein [Bacteroidia bacterium]